MEQQHWTLIIKKYSKEISSEERKTLDDWIDQSEANKLQFEKANQLLAETEKYFETFDPNTNQEWVRFKTKINLETRHAVIVPLWKKQWVRIAASILLVIGLGYTINQNIDTIELTEIAATNSLKIIELPDGSSVTLNLNSSLSYAENFDGTERRVTLVGEGYFEVTEDPLHPFIVAAEGSETEVLGTAFNLKAYDDDEVELIVTKGKVKFSADGTELILVKHDKVNYNTKKKTHKLSKSNELDLKWLIHDAKEIEKKVEKGINKIFKKVKKKVKNQ